MISSTFNIWLVVLSGVVGLLAAYSVFTALRFLAWADERTASTWIVGGAIVMGVGIWTLHFVAMLAYEPRVSIGFRADLTLLSLVFSIGASLLAFTALWQRALRRGLRVVVATLVGFGASAMHYTGMAAMEIGRAHHHEPQYVIASIVGAIALAYLAFLCAYPGSALRAKQLPEPTRMASSAVLLGGAVAFLHYTGMAGFVIHPGEPADISVVRFGRELLATLVAAGLLFITLVVFWLGAMRQWYRAQSLLADRDRLVTTIVSQLPAVVLRARCRPAEELLYISDGASRLTGFSRELFQHGGLSMEGLEPDGNVAALRASRVSTVDTGYSVDYRIRRADGVIRWIRERGVRVSDKNGITVIEALAEDVTERKHDEDAVQRSATHDHLTGTANRLRTDELLEEAMGRAKQLGIPLSVVLIDIDHFKSINDHHGHETGDRVLAIVADALRGQLHSGQTVGRWGGEEFLIVLPGADTAEAFKYAEASRKCVAHQTRIACFGVTVSCGVATYNINETQRAFVSRADKALYAAKEGGRDRVIY